MRREFHLLEKNATSPVVDWLRALCRDLKASHGVRGVGTIGMCLTGNFAISLLADDNVLAGVAAQPSMPFLDQTALHMSAEDVNRVKSRIDATQPAMALRFEGDALCTADKFSALDRTFNTDRHRIDLHTLPGKGHSVLTLDFVDQAGHPTKEALNNVIRYFRSALT
jgi:dienelactone hydrolase